MISEQQEEEAALYALGLLDDGDEAQAFARAMDADPALRALAEELRESAAALALAAGPRTFPPPAGLKARLLVRVAGDGVAGPVRTGRNPWTTWVPWAIAAAAMVAAFVAVLDRNYLIQDRGRMYSELMDAKIRRAQEATGWRLAEEARGRVTPIMQVAACLLEPTAGGSTQPRATVVWDPKHREGELLVTRLMPPTKGHDYQLWAVEEGHKEPVSAGVVRVSEDGSAKVEFKPVNDGSEKVQAFALSLEQAGGAERNQGPILLLGKL